jgi:hypothetical protein
MPLSNGGTISGADMPMLTINPTAAGDAGSYDVVVTGDCGPPATSSSANLTVNTAPAISSNPGNATVCEGETASFMAAANASPSPTVQWQVSTDGGTSFTNIGGAISTTLSFTPSASQNGSKYRAVFTNLCDSATTAAATLTVNAFDLSSSSHSFPSNGGTDSVNVVTSNACSWTAVSNDIFITITNGGSGTGNGTVSYSVASHASTSRRSGTITIGGKIFTVFQGADFLDVPPTHPFYTEIGKLSARGVTLGCGGGNYCPEDLVLREQMAAFIIRALGDFNPPPPASQRFNDVPPTNQFYAFIDEMAARQITLGCGGGNYCPANPVLREQMAAFIMRALGEFNPPTPASQRFNDVPPENPFYNFIDRLAVLQITLGCSGNPPLYCPNATVTRGQMAAFLVRAFHL